MRIGILKTGPVAPSLRDRFGEYSDMFQTILAGHGFTFKIYDLDEKMEFPEGPAECDGWLITGSKYGAYEDHPFIPPLEELIREIVTSGRPLAGICFGHQIIAQALGGRVEKWPNGWAVGAQNYTLEGTPVTLNAWHQDQVTEVPPGFKTIGGNDFCKNAMMVKGDQVLTVQPHPEFNDDFIAAMIAERGPGVVPGELLETAREKLPLHKDSAEIAARIATLFLNARTNGEYA